GPASQRRQALWTAGAVAAERPDRLPGTAVGAHAPALPGMSELEIAAADVWATGVSPDSFPTEFLRNALDARGVVPAAGLRQVDDGTRVLVGGAVTHRQRPATAGGITFLNLEDETGMVNVICSTGFWARYRKVVRACPALLIRGILQHTEGVINVIADRAEPLDMRVRATSRDFR
ncbi:MAG: error-prone DNA polymerase, partial [Actinomycetota bacterium]|nr:error-prone DNA polymerase [Actinomycetota bacterium]